MGLREHRERFGLTQADVIAEVRRLALARGDRVVPGLDQPALSKHENGQKRPRPYYQALYCDVYGATPAELGFRVALPHETRNDDDVNRREFLAGVAGVAASAVTGPPPRVGGSDIEHLRRSTAAFYKLGQQHGGASVYGLATRHFQRLRGLVERGRYDHATGLALRELAGQTAQQAGWLAFDNNRHDVARRWWLEGLHWAQLAGAEGQGVRVSIMANMARQAQAREAVDLATAARSEATTPRLRSVLSAREAVGHAQARDASSARAALTAARAEVDTRHDDDPAWLAFYGAAEYAYHEHRVALALGDLPVAEDAARAALAAGATQAAAYPRNHALDLTNLAAVLAQRGEHDEAAAIASRAAAVAAHLDSARVNSALHALAA